MKILLEGFRNCRPFESNTRQRSDESARRRPRAPNPFNVTLLCSGDAASKSRTFHPAARENGVGFHVRLVEVGFMLMLYKDRSAA